MYQYSTARTNLISAAGTRFVWREAGAEHEGIPVVCFSYLMSTMDDWDPAVIDGLSRRFHVYLFDNRGVGRSEGQTPSSIEEMAEDAFHFLRAMGLSRIFLLGFSMGGMVAQAFTAAHPEMVERLILVGTGPSGTVFRDSYTIPLKETTAKAILRHRDPKYYFLFESTPEGKKQAAAFLDRLHTRKKDRDMKIRLTSPVLKAQIQAIRSWFGFRSVDPSVISCPVLIVAGEHDGMIAVSCSHELNRLIPDSRLLIYEHCGHGVLFQCHERFTADVISFLDEKE